MTSRVRKPRPSADLLDGPPPHDLDAERAVLGAMLLDGNAIDRVTSLLSAADFHGHGHDILFSTMAGMHESGEPIDGLTLTSYLSDAGKLEDIGGHAYIAELAGAVPVAANILHYAAIVREKSQRRRLRHTALDLLQAATDGKPLAEVLQQVDELKLQLTGSGRRERSLIDYEAIDVTELDRRDCRIEYLIPGILAAGQHCLLGGQYKALKSLTAVDLAVTLRLGGHFLGYFPAARPARVAIMSGECGWSVFQENLRRVARAAGRQLSDLSGLLVSTKLPRFGSLDHADAMRRFIQDNELEVVILDCAYLMMPGGDAGNVFIMGELLRSLADVFVECKATMVLLHHATKAAGGDGRPIELENLSFAGFREFAAQWLLLSRRQRYEPGSGHHDLWLSSGGRAGHSGLWSLTVDEGTYQPGVERRWDVGLASADEARERQQQEREEVRRGKAQEGAESDQRDVLALVAKTKVPQTKNTLRDRAPFGHGRFDRAFGSLVDNGDLEAVQVTKGNKRSYEGWKLGGDEDGR